MTYEEWQRRRGVWMEEEKLERQSNFGAARTHIQVAITERAIRDLFDRIEKLEGK